MNIREVIERKTISVEEILYLGQKIEYSVVSRDLQPSLPGFLGFFEGMLFISEDVPMRWRAPQVIHEYVEYTHFTNVKGRCVAATKAELAFVASYLPEELQQYIRMRIDLFKNLITLYESAGGVSTEELRGSLAYLETLTVTD